MSKVYQVCLDPGHGVETPGKCAPDKSYFEHEFNLDMARKMKQILERHGVQVTLARTTEKTLTGGATSAESYARVKIANRIQNLNLFVSLHSNAAGGAGWSNPRGLLVMTSSAGPAEPRNQAANAILARMREIGVIVRSTPLIHDTAIIVLRETNAPAVLVEHGFHTSQADVALLKDPDYRDKLATAECKGILDFLGIDWMENRPETEPWYAEAQKWAMDTGISDGTRPGDPVTRAEEWTALHRLYQHIQSRQ